MKTLSIFIFVVSVAIVAVILYPVYHPNEPAPVEIISDLTPDELNVDINTAYLECSHFGKDWHICANLDYYPSSLYCPAYSEYNESDISLATEGQMAPCFTCPKDGMSCSDRVKEVLTAAGISEDQNSTNDDDWSYGPIWGYVQWECEAMCEVSKEGESCGVCAVGLIVFMISILQSCHCLTQQPF